MKLRNYLEVYEGNDCDITDMTYDILQYVHLETTNGWLLNLEVIKIENDIVTLDITEYVRSHTTNVNSLDDDMLYSIVNDFIEDYCEKQDKLSLTDIYAIIKYDIESAYDKPIDRVHHLSKLPRCDGDFDSEVNLFVQNISWCAKNRNRIKFDDLVIDLVEHYYINQELYENFR